MTNTSHTKNMNKAESIKVVVIGAAGGIGQPLSLLLKMNNHIDHLALYDVANVKGVASDLNHIDTNTKVTGHLGPEELKDALTGANFVIIPAGVPRKPGMTRGDLFKINANICQNIAEAIAINAPGALTMVISNPVNSTTAIFKNVFKKYGVFDPRRLMGVTNLDHVRANAFLATELNAKPRDHNVVVVGGHSGNSIVPILSPYGLDQSACDKLIHRIQYGGDEVVEAKQGAGSSTLAMAYAADKFFNTVLKGYLGLEEIALSTYLSLKDESISGVTELKRGLASILGSDDLVPEFFSAPVTYDKSGIKSCHWQWLDTISEKETEQIQLAVEFINQNVEKALTF